MRATSGRAVVLATLAIVASTEAWAHRTEDYLQAARLGLEPDRVLITLDLIPGTEVAESFIAAVDHDRSGSFSAEEQREYAAEVVRELRVAIDERPRELRVVSWGFPEPSTLHRGEGAIRLQVEATLPGVSAGSHRLLFWNAHLAGHSAYLANALVPASARVSVTAQHRDGDQSALQIDYTVHADSAHPRLWWLLGGFAAAFLVVGRSVARTARRPASSLRGAPLTQEWP